MPDTTIPSEGRNSRVSKQFHRMFNAVSLLLSIAGVYLGICSLPSSPPRLEITLPADIDVIAATKSLSAAYRMPVEIYWRNQIGMENPHRLPVEHLRESWIKIENVGQSPFEWDVDIANPVQFYVPEGATILAAQRTTNQKSSPDLTSVVEFDATGRAFTWKSAYLGPGQSFLFDIVHTGEETDLRARGRLRHGEPLQIRRKPAGPPPLMTSVVYKALELQTLLFGLSTAIGFFVYFRMSRPSAWLAAVDAISVTVLPCIGSLVIVVAVIWLLGVERRMPSAIAHTLHAIGSAALIMVAARFLKPAAQRSARAVPGLRSENAHDEAVAASSAASGT
jgi:hypothetical protein